MTLRPTRTGEFLVIPKAHIDHWIDAPDDLTARNFLVSKKCAARAFERLDPKLDRVGLVIHGYGVLQTHLLVVPMRDLNDVTSGRFAAIEDGEVTFSEKRLPRADRKELDSVAALMSGRI